jgi:hypothetical protein
MDPTLSDEEVCWWLGVFHTDGYIYRKQGSVKEIRLWVGKPSMEMLDRWKGVLDRLTDKQHKVYSVKIYDKRYNTIRYNYSVREGSKKKINLLIDFFGRKGNAVFSYPKTLSEKCFGAYLAGVIDGDGHIQIRKRTYDKSFERLIKISGTKDSELLRLVQSYLERFRMPKGYLVKYDNHSDLWIYVSKKFNRWLFEFTYPYISIKRKFARGSCEL